MLHEKNKIIIIDYGMGNLRSVQKACEKVGFAAEISSDIRVIKAAETLILPGVGEFGSAMRLLNESGMSDAVRAHAQGDKRLLGICLGMQLLFEKSEESPEAAGLGVFKGGCKKFTPAPKMPVPQMGWNTVKAGQSAGNLFNGIAEESYFYFVHSFYVEPQDKSVVAGITDYGLNYCSVVRQGRISAAQFHPEKSQSAGLKLLENMLCL